MVEASAGRCSCSTVRQHQAKTKSGEAARWSTGRTHDAAARVSGAIVVLELLRPVRERKERVMRERVEGEGEPQRSWLTGEVPLLNCCFRSLAERSRRSGAWYLGDLLCAR